MNPKYIDVHSHLNASQFEKDLNEVISRMNENGVGTVVIGVDKESSKRAVEIAGQHENIWACVGFQPIDFKEEFDKEFLESLVSSPKVVAIGECGLDYYFNPKTNTNNQLRSRTSKLGQVRQKKLFEAQIDFAVGHDLPLMLHVRDADEDVLKILKEKKKVHGEKLRGIRHFFTSNIDIAREYIDLGFLISVPGVLTFSEELQDVVRDIPLENLLVETDAPFAAPIPHRGKRNEPAYVVEIFKKIAEIRDENKEEIVAKLLSNTEKLFRLNA